MSVITEITADELAEKYREDGVVVLRQFLDRSEIDRLNSAADELRKIMSARGDEIREARFYLGSWPSSLAEVEAWPSLLQLIEALIGEDIALYNKRILIKDSRFLAGVALHQDLPYWHGGLTKVHAFLPVSPNTRSNGVLRYLAGSHKYGLVGQGDIDVSKFSGVTEIVEDIYPGDIVLVDNCCWHYSTGAETEEERYLLQIVYQPSSDGSFVEQPQLVQGRWLTDLRFPISDALIYENLKNHIAENQSLKKRVAELEQKLAALS